MITYIIQRRGRVLGTVIMPDYLTKDDVVEHLTNHEHYPDDIRVRIMK